MNYNQWRACQQKNRAATLYNRTRNKVWLEIYEIFEILEGMWAKYE